MNRFLSLIVIALLSERQSDCLPFCNSKSFDSVFNVGHLIYFLRCGEVWTFDPRMDGGEGGFLRDTSLFAYSRHWFGENVIFNYGSYSDEWLRFSGFSFQEINCLNHQEDFNQTCFKSIQAWDQLIVLFDNTTAVPIYYGSQFEVDREGKNPLGFGPRQEFKNSDKFLPKVTNFIPGSHSQKRQFVAALYDGNEDILYMGLKYESFYCITYLNVGEMIHNVTEWPSVKPTGWSPNWDSGKCFSGNLIGMFYLYNQAYVVGRVRYDSRIFEDQVYKMSGIGGERVEIENLFYKTNGNKTVHNLKTFFGCVTEKQTTRRKRSITKEDVSLMKTLIIISNNTTTLATLSVIVLVMFLQIILTLSVKRFRTKTITKND